MPQARKRIERHQFSAKAFKAHLPLRLDHVITSSLQLREQTPLNLSTIEAFISFFPDHFGTKLPLQVQVQIHNATPRAIQTPPNSTPGTTRTSPPLPPRLLRIRRMQSTSSRKQIQYICQANDPTQPSGHVLSRHRGRGDGWCGAERLEGRIGLREGRGEVLGVWHGWMGDGRVGDGDWRGVRGRTGHGGWRCGGGRGGGRGGVFDYPHSRKQLVCELEHMRKQEC